MTLQLPKLEVPVLSADAALADSVVTVRFRGTADSEAKPALDHYVIAVHEEACRIGAWHMQRPVLYCISLSCR